MNIAVEFPKPNQKTPKMLTTKTINKTKLSMILHKYSVKTRPIHSTELGDHLVRNSTAYFRKIGIPRLRIQLSQILAFTALLNFH